MIDKKQCTMCKEIKYLSSFYKKVAAADGRMPECMQCRKLIASVRYDKRKKERDYLNQFINI